MTVLQRPSGALQVCNLFWIHVLVYAFLMHSTSDQRARSTGKGRGMNFRTRLAKLERWLVPRCRALRVLEFTSMDNLYISQTWVNALVVVIETAHASLRAIVVCFGLRECTQVAAVQKGSVLAFSRAIQRCQSLTHLAICFLEEHSLCALDLAALPQSLQILELACSPGCVRGARQNRENVVRVMDLAALRGLPHLTSVVLGPRFPLTCFVPAGLSRLTELDIMSETGLVFEEGLGMPGLQRLKLELDGSRNHVRLPALQGLQGLTELIITPRVLVPRDLTPLRLLRSFYLLLDGMQALTWTPLLPAVLPESLTVLQATGGLQTFPEQALALRQLACLHLDQNSFTALPAGMTALSNLGYLTLGFPEGSHYNDHDSMRVLDAVALGDLSAFPCMYAIRFTNCQVKLSHDFGGRHHARLHQVLFNSAQLCRGSSVAALLALHRQLSRSGHRGVEHIGPRGGVVKLTDESACFCLRAATLSC